MAQQDQGRQGSTPLGGGPGKAGLESLPLKVGAFPGGQISDYSLPRGSTVRDALKAAGLEHLIGKADIRHNGRSVDNFDEEINAGSQVLAFSQVRGN